MPFPSRRYSSDGLVRRPCAAAWLFLSALALASCARTVPTYTPPPQQSGAVIVQPPAAPAPPPAPAVAAPTSVTPAAEVPPAAVPSGGKAIRIGLLLPLSGASAALGQAMLDASEMALFDVGENRLQLLPRDTKGSAAGAAEAARSAVADGARLIIGPLLAAEVEAAKPIARGANVPMVAFSTATQLAGDGTFLMGFLPRAEIGRILSFAHAKGIQRVAVLAPQNPYGDIATEAARGAADASGVTLVRSDTYEGGNADMSAAVRRFAGAGADYDALLLPEGGARLKALAPLLPYFNIDPAKVKYLGTGLWDDPTLGTEPELDGAWYAASQPNLRSDFIERFTALYKHAPPRLATLAYDATALAAVLARGDNGGDLSTTAIENPNGFAGVDGIFRFQPDGLVQRGLAVLEVHRGGNMVLDPAPTTFENLGF